MQKRGWPHSLPRLRSRCSRFERFSIFCDGFIIDDDDVWQARGTARNNIISEHGFNPIIATLFGAIQSALNPHLLLQRVVFEISRSGTLPAQLEPVFIIGGFFNGQSRTGRVFVTEGLPRGNVLVTGVAPDDWGAPTLRTSGS